MTEAKKSVLTKWVIAMLVVLNLGTLTIIALQNFRWKAHAKTESRRELTMRSLSRQLQFSEEQSKQLQELRKEHFMAVRPIMENMRGTRNELFTKLNTADSDPAVIDSLTQQIGMLVARQERLTFTHFNDIKAICTPEQLEKFNKFAGRIGMILSPEGRRGQEQRRRGRNQDGEKQAPPPPPPGN